MAVYVDKDKRRFGRMLMSHMLADSETELHQMAERLGLKREWFQNKRIPHYDVCQSKRKLAIKFGAIEIDRHQLVRFLRLPSG